MKLYKIMKNGNSFYCNIPPEFLKFAKLDKGDRVNITQNESTDEIIIKKVKIV